MSKWPTLNGRLSHPLTTFKDAIEQMKANGDVLTPLAEKTLMKETRDLVKRWEKTGLLDGNYHTGSNMAVLIESHSTLIMEDGTRIDYMTEEEKERKLKSYGKLKIGNTKT